MIAPISAEGEWLTALVHTIREISKHVHPARRFKIGAGAELERDLGLDNLDRQTIACALDEHFAIEVPDDDIAEWTFVADVVATVTRLTAAKEPAA